MWLSLVFISFEFSYRRAFLRLTKFSSPLPSFWPWNAISFWNPHKILRTLTLLDSRKSHFRSILEPETVKTWRKRYLKNLEHMHIILKLMSFLIRFWYKYAKTEFLNRFLSQRLRKLMNHEFSYSRMTSFSASRIDVRSLSWHMCIKNDSEKKNLLKKWALIKLNAGKKPSGILWNRVAFDDHMAFLRNNTLRLNLMKLYFVIWFYFLSASFKCFEKGPNFLRLE